MADPLSWRCRDGRVVLIGDMETAHLIHSLHLLQRLERVKLYRDAFMTLGYACSASTPDGASYAAEQEADGLLEVTQDPTECLHSVIRRDGRARALLAELHHRDARKLFDHTVWRQEVPGG